MELRGTVAGARSVTVAGEDRFGADASAVGESGSTWAYGSLRWSMDNVLLGRVHLGLLEDG
jgi:hypothetical protein